MAESRWLDAQAVAKILRVRVSQLPGMIGRGRIPRPSYHLGYSSPRWDRAVLEASVRDAALLKQVMEREREDAAEPAPADCPHEES
jgi:hypothetical protein